MEYTVHQLAELSGISERTLRYYDKEGLLKPSRKTSSGYRIYGDEEVELLQEILFYRELDVSLGEIKKIINNKNFDVVQALKEHREKLIKKRAQIDLLIENVNKSIQAKEGSLMMTDKEKFEGFKNKMIAENEEKYGTETRAKYGNEAVNEANEKVKGMSQADYEALLKLEKEFKDTLKAAFKTGNPAGVLAQKAALLHKKWLSYYWAGYTKEAHAGLADRYVNDERFTAYYDSDEPGMAKFLRDAIYIYTGKKCSN